MGMARLSRTHGVRTDVGKDAIRREQQRRKDAKRVAAEQRARMKPSTYQGIANGMPSVVLRKSNGLGKPPNHRYGADTRPYDVHVAINKL